MSSQAVQDGHVEMRDLHWSAAEKAVARKAFERALAQELQAVVAETKKMASKIEDSSEVWELARYLSERRKAIDRKFDYRYSVLPEVFAILIRESRLDEKELHGLGEDKLAYVRRAAAL